MTASQVVVGKGAPIRKTVGVDALFVLALSALGLVGLHSVYGGFLFLIVGIAGTLIGIAISEFAYRLRQPVLAEVAVALLAFLLLGGATTAGRGLLARLIPTPATIEALGHVGIYGWKDLLTTAPPVGDSANLLAIPYVVGLLAGVAGSSLARRTRSIWIPLLAPIGVLTLGILFGAPQPSSLLLQGAVFAAVATLWLVIRAERTRVAVGHRSRKSRYLRGAALLVTAAAAAAFVGPVLPGADSHARVVLSRYVAPSFQSSQEPSPLAAFRRFVRNGALYSKVLFTIAGVAPGSVVRIATMDEYDGVTWGFGSSVGSASSGTDVFRAYGSTIQGPGAGPVIAATVRIGALGGVWLPEIGEISTISFTGADAAALGSAFRYDTTTETAADIVGVRPGDSYQLTSLASTPTPAASVLDRAAAGNDRLVINGVPQVVAADAQSWSASANGPYAKVMAVAQHLRTTGYFSDGLESPPLSLSGNNAGRLVTFLQGNSLVGSLIVGDGEQYAATFALMANALGVPARVVLGATVLKTGIVHGSDVMPFVEIELAGLGWEPISLDEFMNASRLAHETPPQARPSAPTVAPVAPAVSSVLHSPLLGQMPGAPSSDASHFAHRALRHFRLPGWVFVSLTWGVPVVALFGLSGATILAMKRRRRRGRRLALTTDLQVAGAWSELVDGAIDLGLAVPRFRTRSEQARRLGEPGATGLAARGDASVFGPGRPGEDEVLGYWSDVEELLGDLRRHLGRFARWRATFSLRSFRTSSSTAGGNAS